MNIGELRDRIDEIDRQIVDLYWARSERAIVLTKEKYEHYLMVIADHILFSTEDSEECVNDTYLRAWNSMPDNRPDILSTYLGKITRHLAIDLYRKKNTMKRNASEYALCLDEMEETLGTGDTVEETAVSHRLEEAIRTFLEGRSVRNRQIFVCRYYFHDPIPEIAEKAGMKEVSVRSILFREREELRKFLEKEGFVL